MSEKNDKTIIRTPHDSDRPYVSTCRATAQDRRLTWEARGMLWYLLSKPDDWQVMIPDLMQSCGRDKVRNTLAELIRFGYLEKSETQPHGDAGHFDHPEYRVHEVPLTEIPLTAKPSTAKRPLHNKEEHKTEVTDNGEQLPKEKKTRKANPIFDAIAGVSGLDPATAGAFIAKEERILKAAGYTQEDVVKFGELWYMREFPGGLRDKRPPSPAAIAKYIGWVKETPVSNDIEVEVRHPFDSEAA